MEEMKEVGRAALENSKWCCLFNLVLFIKDEMAHNDMALVKDLWNGSEMANLDKVLIFVKLVNLVMIAIVMIICG